MTAPQKNTAATPESNDGVAAPAVGPASVNTQSTYMRPLGATPLDDDDGVICSCNNTPAMCSYCRAAEQDARELRILSAFYAHLKQEDEQAARVDRFRLHEGEEVWQLGDYSDEADDEPTEDDGNYWIDIDGCNRRGPEPPHA